MKRSGMFAVLAAAAGLFGASAAWARSEFYVSPAGNDANEGTSEKPFASLEAARDAIRALKQRHGSPGGGVTIWVCGGAYRLTKSLNLTEQDSGTEASPVVYRAFAEEQPRLLGGIDLSAQAFRPVVDPAVVKRLAESAQGRVLQADLKALGIVDLGRAWPPTFRGYAGWPELFFDGQPMVLARWPDGDFARVAKVLDPGSKPRFAEKPDRPGQFVYEGDRPARWREAEDVYLNGYWAYKWYNECIRVASIDPREKTVTLSAPHVYGLGGPSGGYYYALNLLEELDSPGEYFLDRRTSILYFWPPGPMEGKEIGLSLLDAPMVSMNNTSHVTLRGLTLEASRGMAITVAGGSGNLIAGCTIRNLGASAVRIDGGTDNGVVSCDLYNMGGAGIALAGGDRATLTPCGNFADNNHIHHYARLCRTHNDAVSLDGVGCRAAHNLIHDAPHHAMDFGGNEHLVEFNEIHHVCLETDDAGAIYTGRNWTVRGTVIRYNFFHDIGGGPNVGNQAIYLDDTACGTTCFGNVISRVYRAFLIGGGRDNVVENNLIVDCRVPVHIDNRGLSGEWAQGEVYETMRSGLAAVPYQSEVWRRRYPRLANILEDEPGLPKRNEIRRNVFVRCGEMSLAKEARERGTFQDNWATAEDPGFVDPAHLNLGLRDGSLVVQRVPGFQAIPFEQIGLRKDEYRKVLPEGR